MYIENVTFPDIEFLNFMKKKKKRKKKERKKRITKRERERCFFFVHRINDPTL